MGLPEAAIRRTISPVTDATSLYDRLGGEAAVMAAVDGFYARVLADPVTKPFFEGLDMEAQVRKQVSFMTWAFDGPAEYRGRPLDVAHARLVSEMGLSDVHFDHVVTALRDTLVDLNVPKAEVEEVCGLVEAQRDKVLGRTA